MEASNGIPFINYTMNMLNISVFTILNNLVMGVVVSGTFLKLKGALGIGEKC